MTGPKPGRAGRVTVDEPGEELCALRDFCIAGAMDAFSFAEVDGCALPEGVRAWVWAVGARPGEELTCRSAIPDCGGVLQAGEDAAARELPGEMEGGARCVLGSENETRIPSPDFCRCTAAGVKLDVMCCCVRPLACWASARIAFMSTLQSLAYQNPRTLLKRLQLQSGDLLGSRLASPWSYRLRTAAP